MMLQFHLHDCPSSMPGPCTIDGGGVIRTIARHPCLRHAPLMVAACLGRLSIGRLFMCTAGVRVSIQLRARPAGHAWAVV